MVNNKIKIHKITSPSFKYGDKVHYVESKMLRNFGDIDSLIQKYLNIAKKKDIKIEMAILELTNMVGDNKVSLSINDDYILWIRYKFFEAVDGAVPICCEFPKENSTE